MALKNALISWKAAANAFNKTPPIDSSPTSDQIIGITTDFIQFNARTKTISIDPAKLIDPAKDINIDRAKKLNKALLNTSEHKQKLITGEPLWGNAPPLSAQLGRNKKEENSSSQLFDYCKQSTEAFKLVRLNLKLVINY